MRAVPVPERLMARVDVTPSCWLWSGPTDAGGYGRMGVGRRTLSVHRLAYMEYVGEIPDDMTVDHLCFVPHCVNPEHLRLLTALENARNKRSALRSHCIHGHEYTPEDTHQYPGRRSRRDCGACRRQRESKRVRSRRVVGVAS